VQAHLLRRTTVLGGVHGTFIYRRVFSEAPWIDVIRRIVGNVAEGFETGNWMLSRHNVRGITLVDESVVMTTKAEPPIEDVDSRRIRKRSSTRSRSR